MAVSDPGWLSVLEAIRSHHPTTPIVINGGHAHVRACRRPDRRSIVVAAGRYMETVGHLAITGLGSDRLRLERRYLDQNRRTVRRICGEELIWQYLYHLNASSASDLDVPVGRAISASLTKLATELDLARPCGIVPRSACYDLTSALMPADFYLNRYPVDHPGSLVNLLVESILPSMVRNASRPHAPLVIINTGSVRFDLSAGPMTRDSQAVRRFRRAR